MTYVAGNGGFVADVGPMTYGRMLKAVGAPDLPDINDLRAWALGFDGTMPESTPCWARDPDQQQNDFGADTRYCSNLSDAPLGLCDRHVCQIVGEPAVGQEAAQAA